MPGIVAGRVSPTRRATRGVAGSITDRDNSYLSVVIDKIDSGKGGNVGARYKAACKRCKGKFTVSHGGGFNFHQLRCVRCGRARHVRFDELGDLHERYLKGSAIPYTVAAAGEHQYVRENLDIEPISGEEYDAAIEAAVKCDCGGALSFDAPARCPKCGSDQIVEENMHFACYD